MNIRATGLTLVSEADGGAGGGSGSDTAPGGDGGQQAPVFTLAAETRPDWLAETFYDPATKAIRVDALGQSYGELQKKLGQRADATRAEILADLRKEVPEKPEGYAVVVPKGLPDGFEPLIPPDTDPYLKALRATAHEAGLKPAQFQGLVDGFYAWQASTMIDQQAEMAKLGDGAQARVEATNAYLKKHLPAGSFEQIEAMTATADAFLGIEMLVRAAQAGGTGGMPAAPGGGGGGGGALTQAEVQAMMDQPAYRKNGAEGDALRAKVTAWFTAGNTFNQRQ
jgi:hypothetical protein